MQYKGSRNGYRNEGVFGFTLPLGIGAGVATGCWRSADGRSGAGAWVSKMGYGWREDTMAMRPRGETFIKILGLELKSSTLHCESSADVLTVSNA